MLVRVNSYNVFYPLLVRSPTRQVTVIYYSNAADWDIATSGGALRIYSADWRHLEGRPGCVSGATGVERWLQITPSGDRLVLFRSDLEHEVRCSARVLHMCHTCGAESVGELSRVTYVSRMCYLCEPFRKQYRHLYTQRLASQRIVTHATYVVSAGLVRYICDACVARP
eukprot:1195786-Prorocentrum_minimum.AAC.8